MPIIYTYPSATPASGDLLLISDVSETEPENATRTCTVGDIVTLVGALVPGGGTVTSLTVSDGTYIDVTATPDPITTTGSVSADLNAIDGTSDGATRFLSKDNTWDVPTYTTDTTYTAGNGLDLTGTVFSTDLRANGGLVINTTELQVDLAATDMAGTLRVVDGGTQLSTLTADAIMAGDGTSAVQMLGPLTNGQLLIGNTGNPPHLGTLLGGTNITIDASTLPTGLTINASALGTMSSFTLAGTAGVNQTISNGDTLTIAAGSGITTTGSATDTVTIAAVTLSKTDPYTGLGLKGSGSGSFTPSTNLAAYWTSGDYVYVEFYMAWLIAEGAAIVGNLILTGLPVAAYQSGLIDNGNCIIHVNSSLGSSASLQAPTTGWVGISGVTTEMTFRRHDTSGVFTDYAYTNKVGDASSYALGGTIRYLQTVA